MAKSAMRSSLQRASEESLLPSDPVDSRSSWYNEDALPGDHSGQKDLYRKARKKAAMCCAAQLRGTHRDQRRLWLHHTNLVIVVQRSIQSNRTVLHADQAARNMFNWSCMLRMRGLDVARYKESHWQWHADMTVSSGPLTKA